MLKYNCENCNFKSTNKKDYSRHIQTKKHLENVDDNPITHVTELDISSTLAVNDKVFICHNCNNSFTRGSSLSRHKKTCMDGKIKDTEVNSLKKENERLQNELENRNKQINTYETMLKSLAAPQTINYFNHICVNYPNTPALESAKSHTNMIAKSLALIDVISMYYYDDEDKKEKKKLVSFIGDYVVGLYKKDKPKDQSIWSTDTSRLTYIVSESCAETKENIWSYDKKAFKTKKIAISPVLQYLRDNLFKYYETHSGSTESNIIRNMMAALGTIKLIDDGTLAAEIARYIAPEFAVSYVDSQLTIKA